MAGSLNHMVNNDGAFRFDLIENMGDAREACEECFDLIALLLKAIPNPEEALRAACDKAAAPFPQAIPVFGERYEVGSPVDNS